MEDSWAGLALQAELCFLLWPPSGWCRWDVGRSLPTAAFSVSSLQSMDALCDQQASQGNLRHLTVLTHLLLYSFYFSFELTLNFHLVLICVQGKMANCCKALKSPPPAHEADDSRCILLDSVLPAKTLCSSACAHAALSICCCYAMGCFDPSVLQNCINCCWLCLCCSPGISRTNSPNFTGS